MSEHTLFLKLILHDCFK